MLKLLSSLWRIYVGVMFIPALIIFILYFFWLFPLDPKRMWVSLPMVLLLPLVISIRCLLRTKKEPHH